MPRIELRDGLWADLREQITHAQDKEIRRARLAARTDPGAHAGDSDSVALRIYIRAWNMTDPDGSSIALEDTDAIERMPMDLADKLIGTVAELYAGVTAPNSPTPEPSGGSPSDSPNPS